MLVITNNINVANILRPAPGVEVIIAGGLVRRSDGGVVGEATAEFVNQFKVDYAVIGASAIEEDGAILDYDHREVRVSQAIIRNRSEENTSELQSLMRNSYAVFCLKQK